MRANQLLLKDETGGYTVVWILPGDTALRFAYYDSRSKALRFYDKRCLDRPHI